MTPLPIAVIGDDHRLFHLAGALTTLGYQSDYFSESTLVKRTDFGEYSVLVLSLFPSEKLLKKILKKNSEQALLCAGLPSKEAILLANEYGYSVYDYMKDPTVAIQNAVATAEGAITKALTLSPITLQNAKVLVIGFGRCGEILSLKCRQLGASVTLCETAPLAKAHALAHGFPVLDTPSCLSDFDILFNTAPYLTLTESILSEAGEDLLILDIASAPGGTDFAYCEKNRISAYLCPSLPAIYAPKTSGQILAHAIHRRITTLQLSRRFS